MQNGKVSFTAEIRVFVDEQGAVSDHEIEGSCDSIHDVDDVVRREAHKLVPTLLAGKARVEILKTRTYVAYGDRS